ncbi:hypothetical protein niasHT_039053 [Heterodera trifolii]|uniref:5'-nucleotidase n=1 Tax=Heterodera trifolii TaxID=157864 RepID=A0ABD2HUT4_9BILA
MPSLVCTQNGFERMTKEALREHIQALCDSGTGPAATPSSDLASKIFVNRTVHLEKIELFGFDMDYTLAEYISPTMERLTFKLCIDYLISKGLLFSICGRFRLHASHGLQFLKGEQIEHYYPNKFVQLSKQIYVLNTLFNLPEAYLFTRLVDFDKFGQTPDKTGVRYGAVTFSYNAIFQDIRNAMDHVHDINVGQLKKTILIRIGDFVKKDERIDELFNWLWKNCSN